MDYLEALKMALVKEKESVEIYKQFSIKHTAMRELFEFLMTEEQKHVKLIEKKIFELYK
jgi:rubrerythrin